MTRFVELQPPGRDKLPFLCCAPETVDGLPLDEGAAAAPGADLGAEGAAARVAGGGTDAAKGHGTVTER